MGIPANVNGRRASDVMPRCGPALSLYPVVTVYRVVSGSIAVFFSVPLNPPGFPLIRCLVIVKGRVLDSRYIPLPPRCLLLKPAPDRPFANVDDFLTIPAPKVPVDPLEVIPRFSDSRRRDRFLERRHQSDVPAGTPASLARRGTWHRPEVGLQLEFPFRRVGQCGQAEKRKKPTLVRQPR